MKKLTCACILFAAIPLSSFAAKLEATNITLSAPLRVGSVDLPPGDYRLIWSRSGTEVQVTWLEHYAKVVATGRARIVETHNEATIGRQKDPFQVETIQQGRFMVLKEILLPNVSLVFGDIEAGR